MSTALLIDDDLNGTYIFGEILRAHGFGVLTAADGRSGVSIAATGEADVVLLDLQLPDVSGIEVLRLIKQATRSVPVIMVTAYGTTRSVVQAMRLGAADYVEKPLTEGELVQTVRAALSVPYARGDWPELPLCHAAARWADAIVKAVDAPQDPRTLRLWGRSIGVSPGSLRNWCRMAGLSPKRSLSLARMIRAVTWGPVAARSPEHLLDVTDRRTLAQLMKLGDPKADGRRGVPRSVEEFFDRQQWITSPAALDELRRAMSSRRVSASEDDPADD